MTLALDKWQWIAAVAVLVLGAASVVHECNRAGSAERELRRRDEAAALTDAGAPPLAPADDKGLVQALADEAARSAYFKTALADAEARLKGVRPKIVEVVRWRTKTGLATGAPRPPGGTGSPDAGAPPPCLIAIGDSMVIEVAEGRLETKAGNRVVVGSAKCIRLLPLPTTTIFEQSIDLKVTEGKVSGGDSPATARPFVAGVAATAGSSTWGVGPLLGYSSARFGAAAGITFPNGEALATVFGRF